MLTIYVSLRDQHLTTIDGVRMTVKGTFVREADKLINLQDWKATPDLEDVEVALMRGLHPRRLPLTRDTKRAVIAFLRKYHAKQDICFDCYSFVNLVKGVTPHKVSHMHKFWNTVERRRGISVGSVIFLCSGNQFHHAAVFIGSGLYISVLGAGGDLEIATLRSMAQDFGAEKVFVAERIK